MSRLSLDPCVPSFTEMNPPHCMPTPLDVKCSISLTAVGSFPPLPSRLASLLTLFRLSQPELFSYFEDEQVRYVEVATSWLTTMLAKEMWLGDVLRLWGE